jgi:hypothetical protein
MVLPLLFYAFLSAHALSYAIRPSCKSSTSPHSMQWSERTSRVFQSSVRDVDVNSAVGTNTLKNRATELWEFGLFLKSQAASQKKSQTPANAMVTKDTQPTTGPTLTFIDSRKVAKTLHNQIIVLDNIDVVTSPEKIFQALSNCMWAAGSLNVTIELMNDIELSKTLKSSSKSWWNIMNIIISTVDDATMDEELNLDDLFRLLSGFQKMGAKWITLPASLQVLVRMKVWTLFAHTLPNISSFPPLPVSSCPRRPFGQQRDILRLLLAGQAGDGREQYPG